MIYTELTMKAMQLAYEAHHGQKDKAGVPYIFHPWHLAESMTDEISTCVALLHDVVEDTAVTLAEIEKQFPPQVTQAVALLTHSKDVPYFEYVRAIRKNAVAKQVKLADLAHNSDVSRMTGMDIQPDVLVRRLEKYGKARQILLEGDDA